jgi:serine/threonine protein phosphatase 1
MRWVVGDIHGMLRPLQTLVAAVNRTDPAAQILFLGDYVNRGPDSRAVVDYLLTLSSSAHFIRGNHDDVLDVVLHGQSSAGKTDAVPVFCWFMNHGLDRTLESYGVDRAQMEQVAHRPSPRRIAELVQPVPDAHREFFRKLPLSMEFDDAFIVHAKWPTDGNDADIAQHLAREPRLHHGVLWDRFAEDEIYRPKRWRRRGFFGHTPVINYLIGDESLPITGPKIVLLDTGLALGPTGRLTAWCIENDAYIQTDHFGHVVAAVT